MRDKKWRDNRWQELSEDDEWRKYVAYGDLTTYYDTGFQEASRLTSFYRPSDSVLEVGCGEGRILKFINSRFALGLDRCLNFVSKYEGLSIVADSTSLPFLDNSFDFVYSINSMLHLDDEEQSQSLLEAVRVSRRSVLFLFPSLEAGFYRKSGWVNPISEDRATELGELSNHKYQISRVALSGYSDGQRELREWQIFISITAR